MRFGHVVYIDSAFKLFIFRLQIPSEHIDGGTEFFYLTILPSMASPFGPVHSLMTMPHMAFVATVKGNGVEFHFRLFLATGNQKNTEKHSNSNFFILPLLLRYAFIKTQLRQRQHQQHPRRQAQPEQPTA